MADRLSRAAGSRWAVNLEGARGEGRRVTVKKANPKQWSAASESGESGEPTQEECPAPQNVQNEANPESTQNSLPLGVESSVPKPAGQKEANALRQWLENSDQSPEVRGQWPVNAKRRRTWR